MERGVYSFQSTNSTSIKGAQTGVSGASGLGEEAEAQSSAGLWGQPALRVSGYPGIGLS